LKLTHYGPTRRGLFLVAGRENAFQSLTSLIYRALHSDFVLAY